MATSVASAARAYKNAFFEMTKRLFEADTECLVLFGSPSQESLAWDNIVAVLGVGSDQTPATVSSNRTREETLTLQVRIDVQRPGEADQEQAASDAAYAYLEQIEQYVRVTDTTLGGVVRDCFLTAHQSEGASEIAQILTARNIVIDATFTAHVRITS